MKKSAYAISVILIVLFILPSVFADKEAQGGALDLTGGSGANAPPPNQAANDILNAFQNAGNFEGSAPAGTIVEFNGKRMVFSGNVKISGGKIETAERLSFGGADIRSVQNFVALDNGDFTADYVESFTKGGVTLSGGSGVTYSNGNFQVASASSFMQDGSIATNIQDLDSSALVISVASADTFNNGCLALSNLMDVTLSPGDALGVVSNSRAPFRITDCSYQESEFEGEKITISQDSAKPTYQIENGRLTCKGSTSSDVIEANSTASVTYGTNCVECSVITPRGSYYYNDLAAIAKDFIITIPTDAPSPYQLCLRKNAGQSFADADGVADFVLAS